VVPQTQVFVASSGTGMLWGTFLFDFDTGAQTTAGADTWWEQQTEAVRDMKA
jgi:hypothetical protein